MITRSQFKVGEFLYGVPDSIESEKNNPPNQRVFIHNGYKSGDGYGILIGWHNGKIVKSSEWDIFCWGASVRRATQLEIEEFMGYLMGQEIIKNK